MPFIPNETQDSPCIDREHNPPSHMVFPIDGGVWVCPNCGKKCQIATSPFM